MRKKISRGYNYNIPNNAEVKVEEYSRGRTKITYSTNRSQNLSGYSRAKNNTYYDPVEGTYKTYKTRKLKSQENLSRALNHTIRPLLENNFFGGNSEVFVTLTYTESMTKFKQLSKDFDKFWRRLCNKFDSFDLVCIYVKEMQLNRTPNSWHIHALIKESNGKNLHINFDLLKKMWGNGGVWINHVLSTYDCTDIKLNIEKEMKELPFGNSWSYNKIFDYMCKIKSKQDVFPSRGKIHGNKGHLQGPTTSRMIYKEANQTKIANSILVNERTLIISDYYTNKILNCIHNEFWVQHNQNKQDKK